VGTPHFGGPTVGESVVIVVVCGVAIVLPQLKIERASSHPPMIRPIGSGLLHPHPTTDFGASATSGCWDSCCPCN